MTDGEEDDPKGGKKDDLLEDALEAFDQASEAEHENRESFVDDIRFGRLGEQWPENIKKARQEEGRPCLTINRMPTIIRQVINDARQNKPSIKVHPVDSKADPHTAAVYDGLIRSIEAQSNADIAYDTALEYAGSGGFGYIRVNTRYTCDDTFDLDLVIEPVRNPLSVYGDPRSTSADGSDWNSAFVVDRISKDEFKEKYKSARKVDWKEDGYDDLDAPWKEDDELLIAQWWRRSKVDKTIVLLSDGTAVDESTLKENKDVLDALGVTVKGSRKAAGYEVKYHTLSGAEVLETKTWLGKYIPIIPVYGEEVNLKGKRYLRSIIRDARGPNEMLNYWRTASTELVALAPKAPFIGPRGAFVTDQAKWETANKKSHSYIEYDGEQAPQRQAFSGVPAGALQEALNAVDDIKATTGLYDASLGAKSNETSGVAIKARQNQGNIATFHFIDNLARGIEQTGRVLIDLIPKIYTGERMIRTLGQDGTATNVQLGQPTIVQGPNGQPVPDPSTVGQPLTKIYDLGVGKYDLTVTTGPSYQTRREEASEQMMNFVQAFPLVSPVIGDLIAKNLDWPGAEEIATRLQQMMAAQSQPKPQEAPKPQASPDPANMVKAQAAMAKVQSDANVDQQELRLKEMQLQIDQFKAETDRLSAVTRSLAEKMRATNGGIPQGGGFA